jgi:hypothetical protein
MPNPNMRLVLIGIIATLTMDVLSGGAIKLQLISPLPPRSHWPMVCVGG